MAKSDITKTELVRLGKYDEDGTLWRYQCVDQISFDLNKAKAVGALLTL